MAQRHASGWPLMLTNDYQPHSKDAAPCLLARADMACNPDQRYQERLIQDVIHRCPNVLPVRDFYPSVTELVSLGTEIPIDFGGTTGRIDNLFVTNDAHLVLVETKLHRNNEATREVIAQTLQYAMAVSGLSLDEFEKNLRRSGKEGAPLKPSETIFRRVAALGAEKPTMEIAEDFENSFDCWRRDGEMLLLIVTDGVHSSAERLVQWMNKVVGTAPYKFGLVELGIFDMNDGGRIIVPRTMLRITEASRHVVMVKTQAPNQEIPYTVTGTGSLPRKGASTLAKPITEAALTTAIRSKNTDEIFNTVEDLRKQLSAASTPWRATRTLIQFGTEVNDNFIPLVSLDAAYIWFQIPTRAVHVLGAERFVLCKQTINAVAEFYPPENVSDPDKVNALTPRYEILQGKVDAFVRAFLEVAELVKSAVAEAS